MREGGRVKRWTLHGNGIFQWSEPERMNWYQSFCLIKRKSYLIKSNAKEQINNVFMIREALRGVAVVEMKKH